MLRYDDIKITAITTDEDYYDSKKEKTIKYKKPKVKKKVIFEDKYCYDLGELYEILKFNAEKHGMYRTECDVTFQVGIEH